APCSLVVARPARPQRLDRHRLANRHAPSVLHQRIRDSFRFAHHALAAPSPWHASVFWPPISALTTASRHSHPKKMFDDHQAVGEAFEEASAPMIYRSTRARARFVWSFLAVLISPFFLELPLCLIGGSRTILE